MVDQPHQIFRIQADCYLREGGACALNFNQLNYDCYCYILVLFVECSAAVQCVGNVHYSSSSLYMVAQLQWRASLACSYYVVLYYTPVCAL
jgi:hypothetical protein